MREFPVYGGRNLRYNWSTEHLREEGGHAPDHAARQPAGHDGPGGRPAHPAGQRGRRPALSLSPAPGGPAGPCLAGGAAAPRPGGPEEGGAGPGGGGAARPRAPGAAPPGVLHRRHHRRPGGRAQPLLRPVRRGGAPPGQAAVGQRFEEPLHPLRPPGPPGRGHPHAGGLVHRGDTARGAAPACPR